MRKFLERCFYIGAAAYICFAVGWFAGKHHLRQQQGYRQPATCAQLWWQ